MNAGPEAEEAEAPVYGGVIACLNAGTEDGSPVYSGVIDCMFE